MANAAHTTQPRSTETHDVTIEYVDRNGEESAVTYYVKLADNEPAHLATDRALERFERLYPKCDFIDVY